MVCGHAWNVHTSAPLNYLSLFSTTTTTSTSAWTLFIHKCIQHLWLTVNFAAWRNVARIVLGKVYVHTHKKHIDHAGTEEESIRCHCLTGQWDTRAKRMSTWKAADVSCEHIITEWSPFPNPLAQNYMLCSIFVANDMLFISIYTDACMRPNIARFAVVLLLLPAKHGSRICLAHDCTGLEFAQVLKSAFRRGAHIMFY